ncbi:MAG TPA: hypothetical protein VH595_04730 [Verrucomicrobiae bacterium]|nr:hypothetical protein [Verrucomicrobiae bacterium]
METVVYGAGAPHIAFSVFVTNPQQPILNSDPSFSFIFSALSDFSARENSSSVNRIVTAWVNLDPQYKSLRSAGKYCTTAAHF